MNLKLNVYLELHHVCEGWVVKRERERAGDLPYHVVMLSVLVELNQQRLCPCLVSLWSI